MLPEVLMIPSPTSAEILNLTNNIHVHPQQEGPVRCGTVGEYVWGLMEERL